MLTYERTDDYVLMLSDEAYSRLADEQRADSVIKTKTAIFCAASLGVVVSGLMLIVCHCQEFGG